MTDSEASGSGTGGKVPGAPDVRLAIFFPEGEEGFVKAFAERLASDAREKPQSPLAVEFVIVKPWLASNPDPLGWVKIASLAGAQVLFIVVPPAARIGEIESQAKTAAGVQGIRCRVVPVKDLESPALSVDLLVELALAKPGSQASP